MTEENQRQYEITFILSPNLDKQGINSIEKEIEKVVQDIGGSIKKKAEAKKQDLAYAINKFESGHYLTMDLFLSPEKIKELIPGFKHKHDILRYFTTTVTAEKKTIARKPKKSEKMSEQKKQKIKQMAEEVTDKEIEKLKKKEKQQKQEQAPASKKQKSKKEEKKEKKDQKTNLKDIDKKIDEILGM